MIRTHILPALGNVKVADVDHKTIAALHSRITKRGTPTRANAVKRLLSKMFSLSILLGIPHRQSVRRGGDEPGAAPRAVPVTGRGWVG